MLYFVLRSIKIKGAQAINGYNKGCNLRQLKSLTIIRVTLLLVTQRRHIGCFRGKSARKLLNARLEQGRDLDNARVSYQWFSLKTREQSQFFLIHVIFIKYLFACTTYY